MFNDLYGKPLVILSGTWEFTTEEIALIRQQVGSCVLLLASERNVDGYERLAHLVDGNAYYWSSVDPDTYPGYEEKLQALSTAIHARGGLWIAPAAPGFDARLIGGTRVVERHGGETLRRQLGAAFTSVPDIIGLISWNEFSENTHIEPSLRYGDQSLRVLANVFGTRAPDVALLGSEASPPTGPSYGIPVLSLGGTLVLASFTFLIFRSRKRGRQEHEASSPMKQEQEALGEP